MHQLQKLNGRHFRIVDLVLRGFSKKDIASNLSMTENAISVITRSPSFQHELAMRRQNINAQTDEKIASGEDDPVINALKEGALRAANRIVLNTDDSNASIANKACAEVLDRAGYGRSEKLDITSRNIHVNIPAEDAKIIAETLRMMTV